MWVEMERATEPHLIERAEELLREYCQKLSLESFSIFRKDGLFMYSSDDTITQPENLEILFHAIQEFAEDPFLEMVTAILVQDSTRCLMLAPIAMGDWDMLDGWYVGLGNCSKIECADPLESVTEQVEQIVEGEFFDEPILSKHRDLLGYFFDLPQILGEAFEKNEDTIVVYGLTRGKAFIQRYDWPPSKSANVKFGELEQILRGIFELDEYFRKTKGILSPKYVPKEKKPVPMPKKLLIFTLLYGIFFIILNFLVSPIILVLDVFILLAIVARRPSSTCQSYSCILGLIGLAAILLSFSEGIPPVEMLTMILIGGYVFTLGILMMTLYGTKKEKDHTINSSGPSRSDVSSTEGESGESPFI